MRAYVITTGVVFATLVAVHVLRAIEEGPQLLKEPPFILTTLAAAALIRVGDELAPSVVSTIKAAQVGSTSAIGIFRQLTW